MEGRRRVWIVLFSEVTLFECLSNFAVDCSHSQNFLKLHVRSRFHKKRGEFS